MTPIGLLLLAAGVVLVTSAIQDKALTDVAKSAFAAPAGRRSSTSKRRTPPPSGDRRYV